MITIFCASQVSTLASVQTVVLFSCHFDWERFKLTVTKMGGLSSLTVQCSVQVLEINDRNGRQDNYIQMEILFVNIDCIARSLRNNSIMQWLLQWVCDSCCIVKRSERVVQGWVVEWCGGGGCPGGWGGWAGNGIQQGTFTLGSVGGIIGHHMRPFMKYLNMSGHCQQCFPAEFT